MPVYKRFEDLPVWKNARDLAKRTDDLVYQSRIKTNFKLRDQMSGSSGSIMDNIAEGFERGGNRELIQFLFIAKGSAGELRSQLYRALDASYITQDDFTGLFTSTTAVSSEIQAFIDYLHRSGRNGYKYDNY